MKMPEAWKPDLPDWLEGFRVPDTLCAQAYDKFGPQARILVKNAIALAQFHFNPGGALACRGEVNPALAFSAYNASWSASCAFLIFAPSYDAAALACAAACLPRLCGLAQIFAFCLGESPSVPLLATLELCGIEDIFCLDIEKCLELLRGIPLHGCTNKNVNPARALLLDFNASLRSLAEKLECILPLLYLYKKPAIALQNPASWDQNMLRLLFGSKFLPETDPGLCDVLLTDSSPDSRELAASSSAPLVLTAASAAFWIFPELDPDFFRIQKQSFDLYMPDL